MSTVHTLATAFLCMTLAACASPVQDNASATVNIAGSLYVIAQLTAGTWTATAAGSPRAINGSSPGKAALLTAIEQASRCKVTDSDYSRQGMQLDAQVDCGGRLKN